MTAIAPIVGRENDMKLCLIAVFASLACGLAIAGADDERRPLREARSENGRYQLRIRTHRSAGESGACCYAELLKRPNGKERPRRVWHEKLVNEVAPARAVIHNGGRYVVALDEFRRGGAAHALAIYDEKGTVLREYDLRELLRKDDWPHVKVEGRALEWLTDARFAFADEPPQFSIRLKWGREIRIDLRTGELADATGVHNPDERKSKASPRRAARFDNSAVPPEILALFPTLTSASAADSAAAASVSDAADARETTAAPSTSEEVLRALAKLKTLSQISGVEEYAGIQRILDRMGLAVAVAEIQEPGEAAVERSQFAGNSAEAGLGVPVPDPAHPVDYVAWALEQTETNGPSGAPFYQAATEQCVKWAGDAELLSAALAGDPEALASPEINAWIEDNREPLDLIRAATEYEYRGLLKIGDDYSLIGIQLPNLSAARELARVGLVEAKQAEQAGDYAAAWGAYRDNFAVGAQISQGPTLIENLVGMAVQRVTANSVLDSFELAGDDIDYAALAADLEDSFQPTRPIVECMQGERAMYLDMIQRVYDVNPESGAYRVADTAPETIGRTLGMISDDNGPGLETLFLCYTLGRVGFEGMVRQGNEYYDGITTAMQMPYQEAMPVLRKLEARVADPGMQYGNPVLATMLPVLSNCFRNAARQDSLSNATRLVANLKAYRQQYGEYPESLDVFGDAKMTVDQLTGGRFAYIRRGDDFELYSLGEDGIADGGPRGASGQSNGEAYWPRSARK